ncbi:MULTISPECIES: hypothetical protein [unclassified Bradyrhizobium]|uniref:hypothetical protein n=1 Tax=unclassified Bradyrhizobium TaxID=2631580 RepID=UPI0012EB7B61|nr:MULTISPECIES: hypothetical protein [unclassified Bradyrhizobium]MCK7667368.1 hypothetical protein [Bradyrhizobium sp. 2S1]QIG94505.1 hypothetical protein G6P99_20045 [Bradyrhizobium sp. 6(2017)]
MTWHPVTDFSAAEEILLDPRLKEVFETALEKGDAVVSANKDELQCSKRSPWIISLRHDGNILPYSYHSCSGRGRQMAEIERSIWLGQASAGDRTSPSAVICSACLHVLTRPIRESAFFSPLDVAAHLL